MATFADRRLRAQRIVRPEHETVRDVVTWMLAMQAQDYAGAKWAVALRVKGGAVGEADVERAVADGTIVRTHVMRGTWQFVTPADARWLLALLGPRVIASSARRYRWLGLDAAVFRKSRTLMTRALRDGNAHTRDELRDVLRAGGVRTDETRLSCLLQRAELEAHICSGARRGKQQTFTLFDARCPDGPARARDEALHELAARYFTSRGPATLDDFTWWSGLAAADARAALASVERRLVSEVVDGKTYWRSDDARPAPSSAAYLLPPFDEFLIAYRQRGHVLDPDHKKIMDGGNGIIPAILVADGRVVGTWQRTLAPDGVAIAPTFFARPTPRQQRALDAAARRYAAYLGLPRVRADRFGDKPLPRIRTGAPNAHAATGKSRGPHLAPSRRP